MDLLEFGNCLLIAARALDVGNQLTQHVFEGLEALFVVQIYYLQRLVALELELLDHRGHVLLEQLLETAGLVARGAQLADQPEELA